MNAVDALIDQSIDELNDLSIDSLFMHLIIELN